MPSEAIARNAHSALAKAGIDGCFYWYDNNWHYHREWQHLKKLVSLGKMNQEVREQLPNYEAQDFSKSDYWMGRTLSVLIKIGWTEDEVKSRATRMREVLSSF